MASLIPFKRVPEHDPRWRDANYYVRFQVKGRPYLWSTKTNDLVMAKKRGNAYREAVKEKRYHLLDSMKSASGWASFAELFDAYLKLPSPEMVTKKRNVASMRAILSAVHIGEGEKLDALTAQMVLDYQNKCIADRPDDPSARVSCNSHLRQARSLFSRRAMISYQVRVPEEAVRAFFKVPMLKEAEPRREIPTDEADARAHHELQGEQLRAYYLARYGGCRASEIKEARRDWIEGCTLYIGGKEFVAKSGKWGAVELPQLVVDTLLASDDVTYLVGPNRVWTVDREMPDALRSLGFPQDKPLQSVRRLYGSVVYDTQGGTKARDALRHASQSTTDKHYVRVLNAPKAVPFAG